MSAKAFSILSVLILLFASNARATVRYVDLNSTNATPPFADWTSAATNIQDAIDSAVDGDFILVTNGVYAVGGRVIYGSLTNRVMINKAVTVQSVNGSATTMIQGNSPFGDNAVRCVYLTNGATLVGFTLTNGATRGAGDSLKEQCGAGAWCESNNVLIADCVIISNSAYYLGGGVYCGTSSVLVSNCQLFNNSGANAGGIYGGTCTNCSFSQNFGVNGGAANSCHLFNCNIVSNIAGAGGGGYRGGLVNCKVVGNIARGEGGGAMYCLLTNCVVAGNWAYSLGGGTFTCSNYNCTITGNLATQGGGVFDSFVNDNCIVYYNSAANGETNYAGGLFISCCTVPLPPGTQDEGGNFTNAPIFVDLVGGDYRLQSNSPCINAGKNSFVTTSVDLDGNPRIVGGTVDIGAYEFQSPSSVLSYAWAQQYGLPTDGSADFTDPDGDGMNNWQEWIAGTDPTNPLSVLKMYSPSNNVPGLNVSWQSLSTRNYFLQRSTDFNAQPAFSAIKSNIVGQAVTTVYTDTSATNGGPYFYRVGVQ